MESQLQGVTEKGWWQCVEDVQHSVHLAGVICVVVIILSRGAGGGADIIRPVSLSHVVTHSQPPSPDMVLTLQLPVSRTFKPLDGSPHDTSSEVS